MLSLKVEDLKIPDHFSYSKMEAMLGHADSFPLTLAPKARKCARKLKWNALKDMRTDTEHWKSVDTEVNRISWFPEEEEKLSHRRSHLIDLWCTQESWSLSSSSSLEDVLLVTLSNKDSSSPVLHVAAEWINTVWKDRNALQFSNKMNYTPLAVILEHARVALQASCLGATGVERKSQLQKANRLVEHWILRCSPPSGPGHSSALSEDHTVSSSAEISEVESESQV
ncbi:hypothetical protein R1sor_006466 [Riccia sorocarpa]|uniref:Uncharacterized protein n=1 Tax=Riccia sorocarpa TaxID=122646 RepID=A0ABD3HRB8_9MARC